MNNNIGERIKRLAALIKVDPGLPDAAPPMPTCPICNGLGVFKWDVPPGDPMYGKWIMCDAPGCDAAALLRERKHALLLEYSGVPGEYRNFSFDSFYALPAEKRQGKELAAAVMESASHAWRDNYFVNVNEVANRLSPGVMVDYSDESRNWIVLQGDLGVGKTGLACSLANDLIRHQRGVLYYRLSRMFQEIQGRYDYDPSNPDSVHAGSASEIKDMLVGAEMLILDEMSISDVTRDKLKIMEDLLRERGAHQRATVLTGNVDEAAMRTMWGGRAVDTICEHAHWITLGGDRLRRGANRVVSF